MESGAQPLLPADRGGVGGVVDGRGSKDKKEGDSLGFWARARLFAAHARRVPPAILFMYFSNAIAESLPLTALTAWQIGKVGMSTETLANYDAFIFLPYFLKPVWAWVSDRFPIAGLRRKPYVMLASVGAATMYLVTGAFVTTLAGAFAASFARTTCECFVELMIGVTFVDHIHKRRGADASSMQALATGVRWAGTIVATLATLAIYPCHTSRVRLQPEKVIMLTAAMPTINFFVAAFFFPESRERPVAAVVPAEADRLGIGLGRADERTDNGGMLSRKNGAHRPWRWPFVAALAVFSIVCIWIGIRDILKPNYYFAWWITLATGGPVLLAVALYLVRVGMQMHERPRAVLALDEKIQCSDGFSENEAIEAADSRATTPEPLLMPLIRAPDPDRDALSSLLLPGLFMFLWNAVPTATAQIASYQYTEFYFTDPCFLVHLRIASAAATITGCAVYGAVLSRLGLWTLFICATIFSAVSSLLLLPLVARRDLADCVDLGAIGCVNYKAYSGIQAFFEGFVSALTLLPLLVLATENCPPRRRAVFYAMYIAAQDIGDSVSGWITAPIVTRLGITYSSFGDGYNRGLALLVLICAAARVGSLVFLPLLLRRRPPPPPPPMPGTPTTVGSDHSGECPSVVDIPVDMPTVGDPDSRGGVDWERS